MIKNSKFIRIFCITVILTNYTLIFFGSKDAYGMDNTYILQLIQNLQNPNAEVRWKAANTLGSIVPGVEIAVPYLAEALQDENAGVRRQAAMALGRIGSKAKSAVPFIAEALQDEDAGVRRQAAMALGKVGPETKSAVPFLAEALQDEDTEVRWHSLESLGRMGPMAKTAIPELVIVLNDIGPDIAELAENVLVNMGSEAVPGLINVFHDGDAKIRKRIVLILKEIGPAASAAVPNLAKALQDNDKWVRMKAAEALGKIGLNAHVAIPYLVNALHDSDPDVRWQVVKTLETLGSKAIIPDLVIILQDNDQYVRRQAATSIGKFGSDAKEFVSDISKLLSDENAGVRSDAVHALEQIGLYAVPELKKALKDEKADVRGLAAKSLGRIGPDANAAVPDLVKVLQDEDKNVRRLVSEAINRIGPESKIVVPGLIEALHNKNRYIRREAALTLGRIDTDVNVAVPYLGNALQDEDIMVRRMAAESLGFIGPQAEAAIPNLLIALQDKNSNVRRLAAAALGRIGPKAKIVILELANLLFDRNRDVRIYAASALSKFGPKANIAVPDLIEALQDDNEDVRWQVLDTLQEISPKPKNVIPLYIRMLNDKYPKVQWEAAEALKKTGSTAIPELINALKNENKKTRKLAAATLGMLGLKAKATIPELIKLLKDSESSVVEEAAKSLGKIATALLDSTDTSMIDQLSKVDDALSNNLGLRRVKNEVQNAIFYLKLIEPPWYIKMREWIYKNLLISFLIIVYIIWVIAWLITFWIRPLGFLRINQYLKPYDYQLPKILGAIKVPTRYLLFVGFLNYHPRVLDAWVKKNISFCKKRFAEKNTVHDRKTHISVPVILDQMIIPEFNAKHLKPTFNNKLGCLLIWGEGGSGKTSLACLIAKWGMERSVEKRICNHFMIPVLIEDELDCIENKKAFLHSIARQIQDLIAQPDPIPEILLERLLRNRRVLVVVDHFSEFGEITRNQIQISSKDFPANALIVTSRNRESLGRITKTEIKPVRIKRDRLSPFMESYLTHKGKSDLFTDTEFHDSCKRLSEMVGNRDITILLAKLFVEQMIYIKEGSSNDRLPENIPNLILSYLNDLNKSVSDGKLEDLIVHRDAKMLAWECLKQNLRPTNAKYSKAIMALNKVEENAEMHFDYFEKRLRLIKKVQPAQDSYRFLLDPLSEYLAGLHLVEIFNSHEACWIKFIDKAKNINGTTQNCKEFLLAVRDCILLKKRSIELPAFVEQELYKITSQ